MQLGDLICSGVHSSILMSATINRNVMNCSKEIIIELIFGADEFPEIQAVRLKSVAMMIRLRIFEFSIKKREADQSQPLLYKTISPA